MIRANPGRFQAIAVGTKTHYKSPVIKVGNVDIETEEAVKILDVGILTH